MDTFEELVETLKDETTSSYPRRNAITTLGRLGDERAVEPLASALKDNDRYIRSEAAKALSGLGSAAAIEPLIAALEDSDDHARRAVIVALGVIGDERAIQPLRQALEDQSYFTRSEAEKSIRQIEERLEEPSPAEEEVEPEPEPEPKLKPPPPPAEAETVKEVLPEQEDVVKEEPEISPPSTVSEEAAAAGAKKLSDADRDQLRGKIFEYRARQATKIAREIDRQQESGNPSSSVFFDMLDGLTSGEKNTRRRNAIITAAVVGFIVLMVLTKGFVLPIVIILAVVWLSIRRTRQRGRGNTMDLLIAGLKNNDPKMRAISARVLGESGDGRAIDALWEAMQKEQDAEAKKVMEEALEKLG